MELKELRKEIDSIDRELTALFIKRMGISADIAEYKRKNGLPILDADRERELLDKIADISGEELYLELKSRGVLVRHFTKEKIKNFNRITVGTREEMNIFLECTEQILKEKRK